MASKQYNADPHVFLDSGSTTFLVDSNLAPHMTLRFRTSLGIAEFVHQFGFWIFDIADISKQFPELAADIKIPEFFEKHQFFSSVFRISSPGLQLWTHYDVMDNLLIQVTGRKRVVLYSPRDAQFLYLSGDKSEVLDVDNPDLAKYPLFSQARRYECTLEAGDVLFIPALWFHNTVAEEFGVGVNVFWKHLPSECYDKTDTYGNKDPTAASRAVQILDRALKTLDELPEEYRDFYARKMVLRIQSKSYSSNFE
ncbi:tRNA wybutosine-synthesizing protein 5 [Pyxicephalus adspersus]|uniref:tRNA wybutosine-synthesizing protein 5 n=1 Tax=Pyxicephalus adspersus TaxID=30357 RepID=UPI003B5B551A